MTMFISMTISIAYSTPMAVTRGENSIGLTLLHQPYMAQGQVNTALHVSPQLLLTSLCLSSSLLHSISFYPSIHHAAVSTCSPLDEYHECDPWMNKPNYEAG